MARERAYIWIDGPPGAGKTTLVERILASCRERLLLAARFVETDAVREPVEVEEGNGETKRYAAAGALAELLYHLPPVHQEEIPGMDFWTTRFVENYSEGIIFEGKRHPDIHPDISVFVMRPLEEGKKLLSFEEREVARVDPRTILELETGVKLQDETPDDIAEGEDVEEEEGEMIEIPDEVGRKIAEYLERGVPVKEKRWGVAGGCEGIARAAVVVINIRGEEERASAERLRAEIASIRKDPKIMKDVLGWRGSRRPISIFVSNLGDPKDRELRKALPRIKRVFPPKRALGDF